MAELNKFLFNAASANAASEVLDSSFLDNLFVQLTITVTAADIATTTVAIGTGINPGSPPALPAASGVVAVSTLPSGGTAVAAGVLTLTALPIGTHNIILRLPHPGPASIVTYTFGSGGGTVAIAARAYGWKFQS